MKKPVEITGKQKSELTPNVAHLPHFVEKMFGMKLYPWQWRVLNDLSHIHSRVALRAANGSGKTRMIAAPAAMWHAIVNPGSTTVVSSGVMRQIREQFMPHVKALAKPFQASLDVAINQNELTINGMEGSRIIGFTAREGGLFEGFHTTGSNESLMIILDEAKSIKDDIFQAVERCQPTRLLIQSSPGIRDGFFYHPWGTDSPYWKKHVVTAFECPHIRKEWIAMQIAQWPQGESDPFVRSMIFGDWMDDDGEDVVITHSLLDQVRNDPPDPSGREKIAGVDFAAGGDENVVVVRQGNTMVDIVCWKEKDTMLAARQFLVEFKKHDLKGENVYADAGGLGGPFCDRLAELGFPVVRVNFGGKSSEGDIYANRGTEMWFRTKHKFERGELALKEDADLLKQLVTRKYRRADNTGKLILESKDNIRRRGGVSPDRADAYVLCVAGERWEMAGGEVQCGPNLTEIFEDDIEPELPGVYL